MRTAILLSLVSLAACATQQSSPTAADAVTSPTRRTLWKEETDDTIVVRFGDEVFAEYHYRAEPKPYIYPLNAAGSVPITRGYPMEEREDEAPDHPHHTSMWFAHGDVNGVDFWHKGGTIEHTGALKEILERGKTMRISMEYDWKGPDGELLVRELRRALFGAEGEERWIDFTIELTAAQDEVVFGDTKEGTFALRLDPELRLNGDVAKGKAVNSEGVTGKDVWGKRAEWVHYQGPVDGSPVGIAIFEHPTNPRHPTWWHARDYGLVAANPFGIHDFESKPDGTGDLKLARGETLTLRYRIWIHAGERTAEDAATAFETYKEQTPVK